MKTIIIVQARMTSTRLPGKILKTVLDKPLLEYQVERLKKIALVDDIIIATTVNKADQPIVDFCDRLDLAYFRGSEEDVLARFYYTARAYSGDVIVRVTSDCPAIDPAVVNRGIEYYLANHSQYDYVSNTLERSFPRGMDTEVFSFKALEEAFNEADSPSYREHVTPFIYRQPQRYRLANLVYHEDQSRHRWTVDTPEDFELIKTLIEKLYPIKPDFDLADLLKLVHNDPSLAAINQHIEQKKL